MTRTVVVRTLLALLGAGIILVALIPLPAQGASTAVIERDGEPIVMAISGRTVVASGEVVGDVWVANGRAAIDGRVEGSVVILNGDVTVKGSVGGDITVVRGGIWIGPQAVVGGDVQASRAPTVTEGAVVDGTVGQASVIGGLRTVASMARSALWIALTVALVAFGIVAMRTAGRSIALAGDHLRTRPFGSAALGLATLVALPVLGLVLIASVLGGLLGLLVLTIALLVAVAGLVVSSATIGRWIRRDGSALATFLLGAVVLRILALVPAVGDLVTVLAALLGAGALVHVLRSRRHEEPVAAVPAGDAATAGQSGPDGPEATTPDGGDGIFIDLRPGHVASSGAAAGAHPESGQALDPGGPSWLDDLITGARNGTPPVAAAEPTAAPTPAQASSSAEEVTDPGPEIIASLPVREDHFADDPHATPGNGRRQTMSAEPSGPTGREAPEATEPFFVAPDPARMPSDTAGGTAGDQARGAAVTTDTLVREGDADDSGASGASGEADRTPGDIELNTGGLFTHGGRAWRPADN